MKNNSEIKILLVDDIEINLTAGIGFFNLFGITPDTASGGEEAAEMIRRKDYDIVFMDLIMPEVDGREACKIIRSLGGEYKTRLKIIALTADSTPGLRESLLEDGMDDFMAKPITKATLNEMLLKWLPPEKCDLKISEINNDSDEAQRALGRMLEKSLEVLKTGNTDELTAELHALKGGFAFTGYGEMAKETQRLEELIKNNGAASYTDELKNYTDSIIKILNELNSAPTSSEKDRTQGDKKLLIKTIAGLTALTEQFKRAAALEELSRAEDFDFGEENNKRLELIKTDLEDHDYDAAMEKLMNFSEVLINESD